MAGLGEKRPPHLSPKELKFTPKTRLPRPLGVAGAAGQERPPRPLGPRGSPSELDGRARFEVRPGLKRGLLGGWIKCRGRPQTPLGGQRALGRLGALGGARGQPRGAGQRRRRERCEDQRGAAPAPRAPARLPGARPVTPSPSRASWGRELRRGPLPTAARSRLCPALAQTKFWRLCDLDFLLRRVKFPSNATLSLHGNSKDLKHQLATHCSKSFSRNSSRSVVPDSLQPVDCSSQAPWDSPGKKNWTGLPCPPPGIFPTQEWNRGLPHCGEILYRLSYRLLTHFCSPKLLQLGR